MIKTLGVCLIMMVAFCGQAQNIVQYVVSFPNAVHHEAEIEINLNNTTPGQPLTLVMSKSSPGRYAFHQFGKNVYNVRVSSDNNEAQLAERIEPDKWQIIPSGQSTTITYTLFANHADGTYSDIDEDHAHFNMPATFAWIKELRKMPIDIIFNLPEKKNWKIATQLKQTSQNNRFSAPHLYYFLDSPTKLGDLDIREWELNDANIRMAVLQDGSDDEVTKFFEMTKKIVAEQEAIFGELPEFDFNEYTFLCDYRKQTDGDGMEHRNSTICSSSNPLAGNQIHLIGTISHEFFHAWNVERIRPKSLEPFDFENVNMSGELWFAEGFTNYYGKLAQLRSGVRDEDIFFKSIGSALNYVSNAPGTKLYSAIEMSKHAPFVDAAKAVDPTNFSNMFTSYYSYGEVIALALDLTLRSSFKDITLDDYMREVWLVHGKTEKSYTNDDLQKILGKVTGDQEFADSFFENFIRSPKLADYNHLLSHAGYTIPQNETAMVGYANLKSIDRTLLVDHQPKISSPLYTANLTKGDRIISVNGRTFKSKKKWLKFKETLKPNDVLDIAFKRNGEMRSTKMVLQKSTRITIEKLNEVSDSQELFKKEWLSSKIKTKD